MYTLKPNPEKIVMLFDNIYCEIYVNSFGCDAYLYKFYYINKIRPSIIINNEVEFIKILRAVTGDNQTTLEIITNVDILISKYY